MSVVKFLYAFFVDICCDFTQMLTMKRLDMYSIFYMIYFYLPQTVLGGYYCAFGMCDEDQYCCGENKCCKYTVEVWYYWAAILLIVIAVFVAICLYIRRKKRHKYDTYKLLSEQNEPVS